MPPFRYNRQAKCYQTWAAGFSLTIDGVTFEEQKIDTSKDGLFDGSPIVVWCQVEAENTQQALAIGDARCAPAIDAAVLVIGYRIDLGAEEAHSLPYNSKDPGILQIFTPLVYNGKPPTSDEQHQLGRQASKVHLPLASDVPSETVRHAMKWYAESVRELDVIDTYMKLFVALDMFVPRDPLRHQRPFAHRAADVLISHFKTVKLKQLRECLSDLARLRNDLFHQGLASSELSAAVQILERIVRAILRRKIGLEDEFVEGDLFKKVAGYKRMNQGGPFGWPILLSKP